VTEAYKMARTRLEELKARDGLERAAVDDFFSSVETRVDRNSDSGLPRFYRSHCRQREQRLFR
jgi:hypothetical protein